MADSYRGVFGAIPYAIRHTESWTMRLYGVVGALSAGFIALVVTLGLVVWMGETVGVESGTFSGPLSSESLTRVWMPDGVSTTFSLALPGWDQSTASPTIL